MKIRKSLLVLSLVAAGCATLPTNPVSAPRKVDVTREGPAGVAQVYRVHSATAAVEASSTRGDTFFGVGNVTDGNLHSAWGPARNDDTPTLTFTLDGSRTLGALAIKCSLGQESGPDNHRILVDVAVSDGDGALKTIAEGLTPSETILDTLDLTKSTADRVVLSFRVAKGDDISQLLVCDVELLDARVGGSPEPEPSASTEPATSASPTERPSTRPSSSPSENPSTAPSESPSASPSDTPSTGPSGSPSTVPSVTPSNTPSTNPSSSPSTTPSSSPSSNPSSNPSTSPSTTPSMTPSTQPSPSPSATHVPPMDG